MRYIHLFLFILYLFSCNTTKNNNVLPKSLTISKIDAFHGVLDHVYVYSFENKNSSLEKLYSFPKDCPEAECEQGCNVEKWTSIEELSEKSKKRLVDFITSENEEDNNQYIIKLIESIGDKNQVLFAGCYTIRKKEEDQYYRFYEYRYIIDAENKIFFVFDYMEDPF